MGGGHGTVSPLTWLVGSSQARPGQLEGSPVLRFPGSSAALTQAFTELHPHLLWEVTRVTEPQ